MTILSRMHGPVATLDSAPAVRIEAATVADIQQHGDALLRAHAAESEPDLAERLDPAWDAYEAAEARADLIILAARQGDQLVGYAVATLFRSTHYALFLCQQDLLFVLPEWRQRGVGLRLINRLRLEAKRRGADRLLMHAKPASLLDGLLRILGLRVEETIFVEDL